MRFIISVEAQDDGWDVAILDDTGAELESHSMAARTVAGHQIPASPETSDAQVEELAGQMAAISEERTARDNEPEAIGKHLFDLLLGQAGWAAIDTAARGSDVIELALRWPSDAGDLHRLPWEMLHNGERFLSDARSPLVAITRLVPVQTRLPQQLDTLPRLLFAIGTTLHDPVIRPGAEIMGVLRHKREGKEFTSFFVESASPERIGSAIEAKKPDVVHLICHGGPDHLRLQNDGAQGEGEFGADQLGRVLLHQDQAPPLVVLSACEAGRPEGPNTAPLAAALVAAGLPLVIAMGGRISDLGCRLFARRFTDSLVAGEPVVQAVGQGRSAALLARRASAASQIEWALPIIFQSESVPTEFAPLQPGAAEAIAQRVASFSLRQDPPVFCGRIDLLNAFDRLLDPGSNKHVLMVSAPQPTPGLGEKRLLDEMTGRALKLGHVAVKLPSVESPRTAEELAAEVVIASLRTRTWMGLPPLLESHVHSYLHSEIGRGDPPPFQGQQDLHEALAPYRRVSETTVDPNVLLLKLDRDLRQLREDAAAHGQFLDPHPMVVVMMGEVEEFDKAADALFDYLEAEGRFGSTDDPVRLVISYGESLGATEKLHGVENRLAGKSTIIKMDLNPFTPEELPLAMQWVLANPRPEPTFADWAYVAKDPEGPWTATLGDQVGSLPGGLNNEGFYIMAYMASPRRREGALDEWFEAADDEDVLRQYLEQDQ